MGGSLIVRHGGRATRASGLRLEQGVDERSDPRGSGEDE